MAARSPNCKAGDTILDKLRVRRTSRTPIKRPIACKQTQRSSGMILTMSVEQSGGITLKTAEGVATSHTRQVSTTSTLFSPLGMSIGVVCESTTENKEVIMEIENCSKDNKKVDLGWNEPSIEHNTALKKSTQSSTTEFRKSLNFLNDQQFEMLSALNVKSIPQLLNIPLRNLLDLKLSNEQLLLLVAMLEKYMSTESLELSAEDILSLKSIAEELEKMDDNDDDEDQPLVIDESVSNNEDNIATTPNGNERSLADIEECFSKIRNVKIPQSRVALKGVRTELSEIIAELDGKEITALRQLKRDEQPPDPINKDTPIGQEEIVTTTSMELQSNLSHSSDDKKIVLGDSGKLSEPVKRAKASRTAKRRRRVNKGRNIKSSTKVTNSNTDKNFSCDMTLELNSTHSPSQSFEEQSKLSKSSSETSAMISQNTCSDVTASLSVSPLPLFNTTGSQVSPTFSESKGIFYCIVNGSELLGSPIVKPFKKRPQKLQFNQGDNKGAIPVDVSESASLTSAPTSLFSTSNVTGISDITPIQSDSNDTQILSKEFLDCKERDTSKPSKSFSAVPTSQKMQPTVLIKKLPTPLRKREHNVDADSTTTSIDLRSSKATKTETAVDGKTSCAAKAAPRPKKMKKLLAQAEGSTDDRNDENRAKPNYLSDISDNSDVHGELCALEVSNTTELCEGEAPAKNLDTISDNCNITRSKNDYKSISPESPLFESIKTESEEFEESGIIEDGVKSSLATNSSIEELKNQSVTSYCSSAPNAIANTPLSPVSSKITSPINVTDKFKDYNSAPEINGCFVGVIYMLKEIDIPKVPVNKPYDLDLLLRTNSCDPRLTKYLRKNSTVVSASSSLCAFSKATQNDPRRTNNNYNSESYLNHLSQGPPQPTPNMLLYGCLQRSPWYQSLMSTMKIQINQTISVLVRAINNFHKIRLEDSYAVFDIFKLYCAGELLEILENLGLFVDVNGTISEKKNIANYAGRSYGCSSVVNATYSFIQPVEPSSVTVQHQHMRSYTAPRTNYSAAPPTFQPTAPFISCYIDSPQMVTEKPVKLPRPPPMYSRAQFPPPIRPRRHCGLKVPYSSGAPPNRSSVSPAKQQVHRSDSEEECWDLDEDKNSYTPSKLPLSPNSDNDYEQSQRNYSSFEKFDDDQSPNYGKSFGANKKRY